MNKKIFYERKNELANEVKSFIHNITGQTINSSLDEGFEFTEHKKTVTDNQSINNSIKQFNILCNVLFHNGWKLNSEIEEFDIAIHLTKDHCFVSLYVGRNGLYVFFEEFDNEG